MLIQRRHCPHCGHTTYQKYLNSLRDNLFSRCHWKCLDCGKAQPALTNARKQMPQCAPKRQQAK